MDTISLLCICKWLPGLCRAQTLQEGVPPPAILRGGRADLWPLSVPSHGNTCGIVFYGWSDYFTERLDV